MKRAAERSAGRRRRQRQQDGVRVGHAHARRELADAGAAAVGRQARLRDRPALARLREPGRRVRRIRHAARRRLLAVHLHARVADDDPRRVSPRREGRREHASSRDNKDVAPEVTGAQHKRLQVTRPRDGIKFWVDVTLPRDWRPGTQAAGHHLVLSARVHVAGGLRSLEVQHEHQQVSRISRRRVRRRR